MKIMLLIDWLKRDCGIHLDAATFRDGAVLAAALCQSLVDAGKDYGEQRHILLQATEHHCDLAFGNACLDQVDRLDTFLRRRAAYDDRPVRNCHSGVSKNKGWQAGAVYADLRFAAARAVDDDSAAAVEEMVLRLVAESYVEQHGDVARDLRQGLGYLLPGEDPVRRRRTARWLRGQNALHFWVAAMLGGREPLVRVADGAPGCWVTAASLFVDRQGRAFTYSRLEHGILRSEEQQRWLLSIIPRTPRAC